LFREAGFGKKQKKLYIFFSIFSILENQRVMAFVAARWNALSATF